MALEEVSNVAVSPDGHFVYVGGGSAIAVFVRNADGTLTQRSGVAGCISDEGNDGACATVPLLDDSGAILVSSDGRQMYVLSGPGDRLMTFNRDLGSGALSFASCISADGTGGQCAVGRAIDNPVGMALSADGSSLYTVSNLSSAVAAFARNSEGVLNQLPGALGCVSDEESGGACLTGDSLVSPTAVAVPADGTNIYVTTSQGTPVVGYDSINLFDRTAPAPPSVKISVRKTGKDASKTLVTSKPAGIRCGSRCVASFSRGSTVTLTANLPTGYRIQWGGPCRSTSPTCRFTARTTVVTANIRQQAKKSKK